MFVDFSNIFNRSPNDPEPELKDVGRGEGQERGADGLAMDGASLANDLDDEQVENEDCTDKDFIDEIAWPLKTSIVGGGGGG